MPQLISRASIVGSLFASDAKVIEIHGNAATERARAVYSPERCLVIGSVVKEPEVVEIRTDGPGVNVPQSGLAHDLESIKALSDVWSLPNGYQTAGTVIQLLPACSECDPFLSASGTNIQESLLNVESLLVDRPRTTLTERLNSALQLNKRAKVLAVMNIGVRHIPLEKESVLDRLLAPVIVPDPLEVLPSPASNAYVPVVEMVSQAYVLNRIPEVLPEDGIPQKALVFIFR